ncbi:hypothetical protein F5146DRAFT_1227667 [Armillaria mellea]|nr:hypothetical protein F5146DRAFT_1227667 [Armillaria mellea]
MHHALSSAHAPQRSSHLHQRPAYDISLSFTVRGMTFYTRIPPPMSHLVQMPVYQLRRPSTFLPPTGDARTFVALAIPQFLRRPAPQDIKGKARAVLTPFLIARHGGKSPCPRCLPDSILRSHEPWWAIRLEHHWDVTYVDCKSVLEKFSIFIIQRIEFVPTRPDPRAPGINMLKILQADDVIVDGDQAVNIDSDVIEIHYKGWQEKVQLRCHHTSITTHGLAYLMSTHIYHHLEAEDTRSDFYSIGNVSNVRLVSIFSVQPGIWLSETAFVL